MPLTVGLTGGIGSGKTTVAELFAARGAGVVDTDEISHRLTAPGQPALAEISRKFGPQFLLADGGLDRERMRERVFADPVARRALESILHPLIRKESRRLVESHGSAAYVVLVVPLLVESGIDRHDIDRVAVVDCEPEDQIRRVMSRSGLSRDAVLAIIDAQAPRHVRLAAADDVIRNDAGLQALDSQVDALHERYVALSAAA